MTIKRRMLLKALLMSPFYGLAKSMSFVSPLPPPTHYYNFFVHGLFFMSLKKSAVGKPLLEIKAPKILGHVLLGGARNNLYEMHSLDDFTNIGLPYGTPTFKNNDPKTNPIPQQVTRSILQFSVKETNLGALKKYDVNTYYGGIVLPWPDRGFFPLRQDSFPWAKPKISSVSDKVYARCGGNIATTTCLQYSYKVPGAYHLHMLMCDEENATTVNSALYQSRLVFNKPENFDFKVDDYDKTKVTKKDVDPKVAGVVTDDENSAKEDDKNWPTKWCPKAPPTIDLKNVSPANCPHFFVG